MKKIILCVILLLASTATFAQNTGYEDLKQEHNLFIIAFILIFMLCAGLAFICVFLYRKGRSNRRRLHDLRLDMKELKEDSELTKSLINNLIKKVEPSPSISDSKDNKQKIADNIPTSQDFNPIHQRLKSKTPIIYDANIKYASSVNLIDNSFFSVTDIPTATSIFVLSIDKSNTQKANFRIYEGALDKIKQVDHFLDEACTIFNRSLSDGWDTIFIQKEGVCKSIDNKWIVEQKLDIILK